ncbi:MAG: bifunctional phosphoribosylaminoimidazolecarboxamide formyltransferase/IMP cyclohydrolase, partial [Kordiimonadaceae bacterium]|nr:bifunctional phosphoribosylaminoimidazolecarboxamide formyltransferase/IMP cyclohydrolase [Kordiimonadaceae bacterium]
MSIVNIKRALISVSDKSGLVELGQALADKGVQILSTGGSAKVLRDAGIAVTEVADHTGFPEMMDGRVKTLHPKIHGGLLALRDNETHVASMKEHDIGAIDLVAINMYPFEATVASGADFDTCIENIDIGGPAMVRSAAKNHNFVTIITDPADYNDVIAEINETGGTSHDTRKKLSAKAYSRTAAYDTAISSWFSRQNDDTFPERMSFTGTKIQECRYGENPHQVAAFYANAELRPGIATATQHQGKDLSYNNLNDTDAAFELVSEFDAGVPTVAIIKHANPCGVATGTSFIEAYAKALKCDPVSAFGGIV